MPEVQTGRVVVLNGSSSAGKSSIAVALQRVLAEAGEPWVVFGWDDFVPRLPDRWHSGPGGVGDLAADGCTYRVVRDEPFEALLDLGDVGRKLLAGYHRTVAAIARSGISVIVDEVMITRAEWDDWHDALASLDVRWVGVGCDPDVVERRERERGDRYLGLARGTAALVHRFATYDIEIDTATTTADLAADRIAAALTD